MYRGYQIISLTKENIISRRIGRYSIDDSHELLRTGKELVNGYKDTMDETLSVLLEHEDGVIDGERLAALWFPNYDAEVFISHSHSDKELATLLAGRLKRDLGIVSFVDSNVWGYRDALIETLRRFCKVDNDNDIQERMKISAHVDCMLNKAITQMMYSCECLFFLNTANSVSFADAEKFKTCSPWISTELEIYRIIQKRPHNAKPILEIANEQYSPASGWKVYHDLRFDKVYRLDAHTLIDWINKSCLRGESKYTALGELYATTMK